MRLMLTLAVLLLGFGCSLMQGRQPVKDALYAICRRTPNVPDNWLRVKFSEVAPSDAHVFVHRMLRDFGFLSEENFRLSYDVPVMTDKLSRGKAQGYYAETAEQELFLYLDLEMSVYYDEDGEDDEEPYRYYRYDYVIYDKPTGSMIEAVSGVIEDWELNRELEAYRRGAE